MRNRTSLRIGLIASCAGITLAATLGGLGCGSGGNSFEFLGSPFTQFAAPGTGNGNVNTNSRGTPGTGGGGLGVGGSRAAVDACSEAQSRRSVRISLQNRAENDFVHYFLLLIASIDVDGDGSGAVCPDDIDRYTSFGYVLIGEGDSPQERGNLCIRGPALVYFHRDGRFRAGGGQELASAVAPAQGQSASFDAFFTSGGAVVPIPDRIIFQNPGGGDGLALRVSRPQTAPCGGFTTAGDPDCRQDSFYYVDETDQFSGTTQIGLGSGRRVPGEIQNTGCSIGTNDPGHRLAPSGVTANNSLRNEFLRGGSITYVFLRDDQTPQFPQLLWRVTDAGGAVVHDFDDRAGI